MGFITIILFIIGFFAFFSKQKQLTLMIIAVLASQYFRLVDPNFFIGPFSFQHGDFALLLIFSLLPFRKKLNNAELNGIRKSLILFFIFLFVSILYDLSMRSTTPMQIFRTTRKTGYLAFFFLLTSFPYKDYQRLIQFIFIVTVIHAFLYIFQYILGYAFLPGKVDENELGGVRFGNSPVFLIPILVVTVFSLYKKKYQIVFIILFLISIVFSQSRGMIVSAISILLVYALLANKLKIIPVTLISLTLIIGYNIIISYFPIIEERFLHLFTEINEVNKMNYNDLNAFYHQGSFIFRWGVTYERLMYVLEDPVRIILGVGYIPDIDITYPIFTIGTHSPTLPTGYEQYNSVDIFFPNIITRYGIVGSLIFLFLIFEIFLFSFKNRLSLWGKVLLTYLVSMLFISLINETFYNGFNFLFIFFFMGLTIKEEQYNLQKTMQHIR
jgi:hypothetical protein